MDDDKYNILFIIVFFFFQLSNVFVNVVFLSDYLKYFKGLSLAMLIVFMLLRIKNIKIEKKYIPFIIIFFFFSIISFFVTDQFFFIILFIILISSASLKYRDIIRYDFKIKIILTLLLVGFSLFGLTDEMIIYRNDSIRHSFGFYHPNVFAMYLMIIYFEYIYLRVKVKKIDYVIGFLVAIFITILSDSRTSCLCIILFILMLMLEKLLKRFFNTKFFKFISRNLFLFLTILSVILVILHIDGSVQFIYKFDAMLSGRIYYQTLFFHKYDIKLFGNFIEYFNSIDNIYFKVLLNFGSIGTLILSYMYNTIFRKISENKNYILFCIFLIFMLYGFVESLILNVGFNSFILLIASILFSNVLCKDGKEEQQNEHEKVISLRKKVDDPLVSIIIPSYNAALYLDECIASLVHQTYRNIEIIVVDDGSKDNTKEIVDKWKYIDKRIIYWYQRNSGVSFARNFGISKAKGEYICFVDSDDVVSSMYVSDFVENIGNNDCVCCKFREFYDEYTEEEIGTYNHTIYSNKNKFDLIYDGYDGYIWNKMYRKSIITKNKLLFERKIYMCEDQLFNFNYFDYCKKIICLDKVNYYYRKVPKSLSNNFRNIKWFTIFVAYKRMMEYRHNYSQFVSKKLQYNLYRNIIEGFVRLKYVDANYKTKLNKEMTYLKEKYKYLKKNIDFKDRVKLSIYSMFPELVLKYKHERGNNI